MKGTIVQVWMCMIQCQWMVNDECLIFNFFFPRQTKNIFALYLQKGTKVQASDPLVKFTWNSHIFYPTN